METDDIKVLRELKDDAFARTELVEVDGERWLRKEYRFRLPLGRLLLPLARHWARHEMAMGRILAGIEGVPGVPIALSDTSFRRPWIDGDDLRVHRKAGQPVSDTFFDELLALVRCVHARGVAYADLEKRDNIIVGTNGKPHLIDFQVSLKCYEGPSGLRRALSSWWIRYAQADDLRYVYKHKRRIRPDQVTPDEIARSHRRSPLSWFKRVFYALTFRRLKRLIYPKGSNETFRFAKPRTSKPERLPSQRQRSGRVTVPRARTAYASVSSKEFPMSSASSPPKTQPPVPRQFTVDGSLTLRADTWGDPTRPPVVLLHGGGQTRHAWTGTAATLAEAGWYALAVDQRGHGESDWAPEGDYDRLRYADDVIDLSRALHAPPVLVGASLGGISSLLAIHRADGPIARALILVDIATRMEQKGLERIFEFMRAQPDGFGSLDEAADAVAAYNPHRRRPSDTEGLRKNLRQGEDGRWRWHWDPRFIEQKQPAEPPRQWRSLDEAAASLEIPTLLVRGRMSDILSEEGARVFLEQVPHARFADISEAGHMVAGDRNDLFSDAVLEFLRDELGGPTGGA